MKYLLYFAGHVLGGHNLPIPVPLEPSVGPREFDRMFSAIRLSMYCTFAAVENGRRVAKKMYGHLVQCAGFF